MLTPHPEILRSLVDDYEAAAAAQTAAAAGPATAPSTRVQDLAYTLCVSTGTRDVGRALEKARRMLAATAPEAAQARTARPATTMAAGPATTMAAGPATTMAAQVRPAGVSGGAAAVHSAAG
ncbi:DUF5133 domain-containing protein [Streptomyces sp. NPDC046197]|uniref:DUF5133 domain-containing protein n=1 Tax=Streptomyces sp. NPDC046197 TaxID=3154337 RepID=UPI0033DEE09C